MSDSGFAGRPISLDARRASALACGFASTRSRRRVRRRNHSRRDASRVPDARRVMPDLARRHENDRSRCESWTPFRRIAQSYTRIAERIRSGSPEHTGLSVTGDPPRANFLGVRPSARTSRQARSGHCRSSAARARTLILHGFQSRIMDADGVCLLTARAALFFTPHASLMQGVPCLPLSCPFGNFRGQTGSQGCWTEVYYDSCYRQDIDIIGIYLRRVCHVCSGEPCAWRAQCAISSTPCSFTTRAVPAPIHDRYTFRIPVQGSACSGIPCPCPYVTILHALSMRIHHRPDRHCMLPDCVRIGLQQVQTRPRKLRGLPVNPLRNFPDPERR